MGSMCEMNFTFGNGVVETEFGFEWTEYSTSIYGCLYIPMGLWGTNSCHQEVLILKMMSSLPVRRVVNQIKYFDQRKPRGCRCSDEA